MYISQVKLRNIKGFHGPREVALTLTRPDGSHAGWTVIAGRNGAGKSTLLQAIALTVSGPRIVFAFMQKFENWITHGASTARTDLQVTQDASMDVFDEDRKLHKDIHRLTLSWQSESVSVDEGSVLNGPWSPQPSGWLCAAYGPFRRLTGSTRTSSGRVAQISSLFTEDASLAEGVSWLIQQHLRALEGEPGADDLKQAALRLLGDGLLPDDHQVDDVTSDGLWVTCRGNRFPLRETSDGYRTVTALVVDLLKQIHDAYGWLPVEGHTVTAPGVVIIDEVDAHLHVTWQQRIGSWLKAHFPNIQFIVTTHSPYICQAADPGGLIRLPGPDEQVAPHVVDQDLYERVVYGSGDDAVLSELFGLDSPYSEEAERLRRQLVQLESKVITGAANEQEVRQFKELREKLTSSLTARVDEVAARLRDT